MTRQLTPRTPRARWKSVRDEAEVLARTVSCSRLGCAAGVGRGCVSVVTGLPKARSHDTRYRAVAGLVSS